MSLAVTPEQFEEAVSAALDAVPPQLMAMLDNVAFFVEEEPLDDLPDDLLGIYEGTPLTERDLGWSGALPDRIILFRGPLQRMCADLAELEDEITITVVHEIAHHFGIEDDRLHDLGWG